MVPVGRPYGLWRDWVMQHARGNRLSLVPWDSFAFLSFQMPIYAAIVAVSGASGRGLLLGILGATIIMLALGRPYGAFLYWVRGMSGLPPRRHSTQKPQQLIPMCEKGLKAHNSRRALSGGQSAHVFRQPFVNKRFAKHP